MVTLCILVGLGLATCGVIIAYATKKGHKGKTANPPPLPPRVNVGIPSSIVNQSRTRTSNSSATRALPPRRSPVSAAAKTNRRAVETSYGPRGIKPSQFPCCPFDKQRNIPGEQQLIFWDSNVSYYRCSRGHQFKSNGKPF